MIQQQVQPAAAGEYMLNVNQSIPGQYAPLPQALGPPLQQNQQPQLGPNESALINFDWTKLCIYDVN